MNFDPSDQTAPHLNHGDLAGDQTVSDDHVAPLDVQAFLGHGGGDEQVDLSSVKLPEDVFLLTLGPDRTTESNIHSLCVCVCVCEECKQGEFH